MRWVGFSGLYILGIKKRGDDEWEITPQSSSPITNQIKKGCISCEDGFLTTLKQLSLPENGTFLTNGDSSPNHKGEESPSLSD